MFLRILVLSQLVLVSDAGRDEEVGEMEVESLAESGCAGLDRHLCNRLNECDYNAYKKQCTLKWSIFTGEPKFSDVAQGRLGTCFFLAAIASVAHTHPEIIKNAFINQHLWKSEKPVYTVLFNVYGKPTEVAVTDMVPADKLGIPYFVRYNDGLEFWPLIMEKAWAKLHGSFKNSENGNPVEAFKAITMAPVDEYNNLTILSWETVFEATKQGFPMYGGTDSRKQAPVMEHIRPNHAYAVLSAGEDAKKGRFLTLYNPWSNNNKVGSLSQIGKTENEFDLTFEEFKKSFQKLAIAKIRDGYSLSSTAIPLKAGKAETSFEFTVRKPSPFNVQVLWPSQRMTSKLGCPMLAPDVTLNVAKVNAKEHDMKEAKPFEVKQFLSKKGDRGARFNVRVDVQNEDPGTYRVSLTVDFRHAGAWLHDVMLGVYAGEDTTIKELGAVSGSRTGFGSEASVLSNEVVNEALMVPQPRGFVLSSVVHPDINGKFTVKGYSSLAKKNVYALGNVAIAVFARGNWTIMTKKAGALYITNAGKDSDEIPEVGWFNIKTKLSDMSLKPWVGKTEGECSLILHRQTMLGHESIIDGKDVMFPPAMSSIGSGGNCGDKANDVQEDCSKYNSWISLSEIMAGRGRANVLIKGFQSRMFNDIYYEHRDIIVNGREIYYSKMEYIIFFCGNGWQMSNTTFFEEITAKTHCRGLLSAPENIDLLDPSIVGELWMFNEKSESIVGSTMKAGFVAQNANTPQRSTWEVHGHAYVKREEIPINGEHTYWWNDWFLYFCPDPVKIGRQTWMTLHAEGFQQDLTACPGVPVS